MLKSIINLFKCCKPQSRATKENPTENINDKDSEKPELQNVKHYKGSGLSNISRTGSEKFSAVPTKCSDEKPKGSKPADNSNINYAAKESNSPLSENKETIINLRPEMNEANNQEKLVSAKRDNSIQLEDKNNNKTNYNNNENYINQVKVPEININSFEVNKNYSSNDTLKHNDLSNSLNNPHSTEDEFNKIIVPDRYIRDDERNHLVWVCFIIKKNSFFINIYLFCYIYSLF